jgi:nitrite reductase/ring-hydroxylating ferredoxin subunit
VSDTGAFDTGISPGELDPDRPRSIHTPWGEFALFWVGARVLCAQSFCPHLGGPLFQGTVFQADGGEARVTCPWHQWVFSLETGDRVDLAGRIFGRGHQLVRCEVAVSQRGTIVLREPVSRPRI